MKQRGLSNKNKKNLWNAYLPAPSTAESGVSSYRCEGKLFKKLHGRKPQYIFVVFSITYMLQINVSAHFQHVLFLRHGLSMFIQSDKNMDRELTMILKQINEISHIFLSLF